MNIQCGVKNRKLARAMLDADLGMPREFIAYKGGFAAISWKPLIGSIPHCLTPPGRIGLRPLLEHFACADKGFRAQLSCGLSHSGG
jgi:hypothetical protein